MNIYMKNKYAKFLHSIVKYPILIISVLLQLIAWTLKYIAHKLNMMSDWWGIFYLISLNLINKIMTRKEELLKELAQIEEEENQFSIKYKSLVGKYFKFRNCYSCPIDDSDYWYSYYRITSISPNDITFHCNGISCQCTTFF